MMVTGAQYATEVLTSSLISGTNKLTLAKSVRILLYSVNNSFPHNFSGVKCSGINLTIINWSAKINNPVIKPKTIDGKANDRIANHILRSYNNLFCRSIAFVEKPTR
jgi:hypothetical protein